MNKKKQYIAIAKACGYTLSGGRVEWWTDKDGVHDEPPDYLNDLNAMHDVEKTLSRPLWDSYISELHELIGHNHIERYAISASAAQRAEAFLRTLNLWEE